MVIAVETSDVSVLSYVFTVCGDGDPAIWDNPGGWLTVVRLVKCHPFHNGGIDHVPGPERTNLLSRPKC